MAAFVPAYGLYDVTAYGAKGDGTTDDSAAIQDAENACEKTGGVIYFPPGRYVIGPTQPTITIGKSGIQWRGAGAGSSVVLAPPSVNALTLVQVGSTGAAVSDVTISDLGFQGNGVNPTGSVVNPPVVAFGSLGLIAVSSCKVIDCDFTANTGPTVGFVGVAHGEVRGCSFLNVGYFNGNPNDPFVTPAVITDNACTDIRVHHNYFEGCQYDGVRIKATQSEVSSNFFDQCFASAINVGVDNGDGSDVRVLSNYAQYTHEVVGNNQAIYIQHLMNYQAIGNIIHHTDGDGIAGGGCTSGACLGNILYDNCVKAGDCAVQYIGQPSDQFSPNIGIGFIGNVCYDDRSNPTQIYGFRFFTTKAQQANAFPVIANTFLGNQHDISIDSVFALDSNISIANTNGWNDRLHETAYNPPNGLTGTTQTTSLLNSDLYVGANSVLLGRGIRMIASGSATGTMAKSFFLGFGSSGNIMVLSGLAGGNQPKYWQLVAYVVDESTIPGTGNTYLQYTMIQFWYDGVLVYSTPAVATLTVDTTSQVHIHFEGKLASISDNIFCDFLSVERV